MNGHKEIDIVELFGDRIGELLIDNGFADLDAIHDAEDDDLLSIEGIGIASAALIRQKMADREQENAIVREMEMEIEVTEDLPGVSDTDATSVDEVKPDEVEAETAEESIAEETSAVEAVAETAPAMGPNIAIVNRWPTRLKVVAPSGTEYLWLRAGNVQQVMASDVEFVMGKNRNVGRACCGTNAEKLYFEIL